MDIDEHSQVASIDQPSTDANGGYAGAGAQPAASKAQKEKKQKQWPPTGYGKWSIRIRLLVCLLIPAWLGESRGVCIWMASPDLTRLILRNVGLHDDRCHSALACEFLQPPEHTVLDRDRIPSWVDGVYPRFHRDSGRFRAALGDVSIRRIKCRMIRVLNRLL